MVGKHIEIFLVDGVPGGITTAEIAGWTGHVLSGPRADLAALLARDEAQRNGAYLLLGSDPEALEGTQCYIGRSEDFRARIRNHNVSKEFWDRVVLISSRDDSFNEGHWGYLEARLIELASDAGRCSMPNVQTPRVRKLSEAQMSDMEAFLKEVEVILPVLGVNVLRARKRRQVESRPVTSSPVFSLKVGRRNVDARGQVIDGEFFLMEGSTVVAKCSGQATTESTRRMYAALQAQHEKLVADGSIEIRDGVGHVTRDIAFSSPSGAGAIASGRACNGRTSWLWSEGTFGDWENRGVK